ncbi:Pheromone a factor receptor [Spathaspora sp. JA1]|nr:Pheromone a factor receptor [Spathaspora sp. JA1]
MIWGHDNFYEAWDGKVWCDATIRLEAGSSTGKICAITSLILNLYMILRAKPGVFLQFNSWRKRAIDLSICLITPIFIMSTNYIISAFRYAIFKYEGCVSMLSPNYATIGLDHMWPIIWSAIAVVIAIMTLYKFFTQRKEISNILLCTNSGLTYQRFARLLIFCLLIILAMAPLSGYYFADIFKYKLRKFEWDDVHRDDWGQIMYYNAEFTVGYRRLVNSILSIIAFLLFGLGSDAVDMYKSIIAQTKSLFSKDKSNDQKEEVTYLETLPSDKVPIKKTESSPFSQVSTGTTLNEYGQFSNVMADSDLKEATSNISTKPLNYDLPPPSGTFFSNNDLQQELQNIIEQDTDTENDVQFIKFQVKQK